MTFPIPVMKPGPDADVEALAYDGSDDELFEAINSGRVEEYIDKYLGVSKRLSPAFGVRSRRRAQLVARLKQRRRYDKPVRGGTGKQARTRRRTF